MGEVLHGSLLQLLLEHCDFLNIDIPQGSVATRLRCGKTFKYELVANLPLSEPVKEFWKSVNIWGSYGQEFGVLFFWDTVYTHRPRNARVRCLSPCHWSWTGSRLTPAPDRPHLFHNLPLPPPAFTPAGRLKTQVGLRKTRVPGDGVCKYGIRKYEYAWVENASTENASTNLQRWKT